jgi:taurine dioxygenase
MSSIEMTGETLVIHPVAGRIGAVIEGVHLTGDLHDAVVTAIRAALLKHKVVFFRGQHHVDDEAMEGFAERMGDPIAHPNAADPHGSKYLLNLAESAGYGASVWHTDMTFLPAYPAASILRTVALPDAGGDTMWANTSSAYAELPEPLKAMVDRLWALHSNDTDFDADFWGEARRHVEVYAGHKAARLFETEHPVVRVHPETGERALVLGKFVKRFLGFDARQSHQVLSLLQEYITRPENCVRWQWRLGDVAMWDNRATQHRSVADFGDQPRHLRRATIHGTIARGIDGCESRVVKSPELIG